MIKARSEVGLDGELQVVPVSACAAIYVARNLADASPTVDNDFLSDDNVCLSHDVYDDPELAAL